MEEINEEAIKLAVVEVTRCKVEVAGFEQCNAYGRTLDEQIEFGQKYAIAKAKLIVAQNAFDAAMPRRK